MSMIERVARAMAADIFTSPWDELSPLYHEHFTKLARAAIEAMREPTKEMMVDYYVDITWKQMIDEALK